MQASEEARTRRETLWGWRDRGYELAGGAVSKAAGAVLTELAP